MNIPHGRSRGVGNKKANFALGTKIAGEHRRISGYDSDDPQFYHQHGAGAGLPALDPKIARLPEKADVKQVPVQQRGNGVARDQSQSNPNQDHSKGLKVHPNSKPNGRSAAGLAAQKHSRYSDEFLKGGKTSTSSVTNSRRPRSQAPPQKERDIRSQRVNKPRSSSLSRHPVDSRTQRKKQNHHRSLSPRREPIQPSRGQREHGSSQSSHQNRCNDDSRTYHPFEDFRFPPPNTATPNKVKLVTQDSGHIVYYLLYQNRDPERMQQARDTKAGAKEFRNNLSGSTDREKLIQEALRSGTGLNQVSVGPRGTIWKASEGSEQLVACLLGQSKVQMGTGEQFERFDLFGETVDEEILLISTELSKGKGPKD